MVAIQQSSLVSYVLSGYLQQLVDQSNTYLVSCSWSVVGPGLQQNVENMYVYFLSRQGEALSSTCAGLDHRSAFASNARAR